ncbi:HutD family protein [Brenneria roseae subsp. americana]|uniref:HutD family protein n=1 Tax=Brenneria roseae subsp. americana TaxID=1508507 RepID=A0A2U1TTK6_9GAMM|nr:HutD family protein [Brenneria roseae]PWC12746.1 HutD family protein [Brenneria roseae subsp. americana]
MSQLHRFSFDTLPLSRWRNGGGETREIVSWPPGAADFSWRVSIATIAQDGPFSVFAGIDRSITLLSGAGVHLFSEQRVDHALIHPGEPFAFSGDVALSARRIDGATTDFNIMTRRGVCRAAVTAHGDSFIASGPLGGVLYVMSGEWKIGRSAALNAGEGVYWAAKDTGASDTSIVESKADTETGFPVEIQGTAGMILWGAITV